MVKKNKYEVRFEPLFLIAGILALSESMQLDRRLGRFFVSFIGMVALYLYDHFVYTRKG